MLTKKSLKSIGWREWVSLPEFGITAIKAKVDSGARTSALHATHVRYIKKTDGSTVVSFLVTSQLKPLKSVRVEAPLIEKRLVRSSIGHATLRPVILTHLQLDGETWPIEITLINRDPMGFRMLIGRQALKRRFLINPSRSFVRSKEIENSRSEGGSIE